MAFPESLETEGNFLHGRIKTLARRIEAVAQNVEVRSFPEYETNK
jgi:hypothetical protein